jgi:hypothetical protein
MPKYSNGGSKRRALTGALDTPRSERRQRKQKRTARKKTASERWHGKYIRLLNRVCRPSPPAPKANLKVDKKSEKRHMKTSEYAAVRQREGLKSLKLWLKNHVEPIDWKTQGHEGVMPSDAQAAYKDYVLGGQYNIECGRAQGNRDDNRKFLIQLKNSQAPHLRTFVKILDDNKPSDEGIPFETKRKSKYIKGKSLKRYPFKLK